MNIAKFISLALKIKKVFKSSGKGVMGLSKTVIGVLILLLPLFGLQAATDAVSSNQVGLSEALFDVIQGIGVIITVWGIASKNDKIEKLEAGKGKE